MSTRDTGGILRVRHEPWLAPAHRAAMPLPADAARGLSVTDRALRRDGIGWVPISGELHYSRLPRERWAERLRQLRAAGVTVASTYVFWLHHVASAGSPRFDGALDVAAFVDECEAAGLDLVLRIGPWAHGEARNGGFPDWVQGQPLVHRSDDPRYLDLVREWFGQLATALQGRATPGGPIIAIQLENELYDDPDHLVTLKRLAREAGMAAPLWTATAWGGAELPHGEVFPVFSGYADGFWVDPQQPWDATFRAHFVPSHEWDDPGVGADVRAVHGTSVAAEVASASADLYGFPPATCELGSGMATAYHRRPVLEPLDIAALAHTKIGNGSAWQGYFMYAGGRNSDPGLQESQDTGYPNDMPELSYDFHAPIGQSGNLSGAAPLLRAQHAFLNAFGDRLAEMSSTLPDDRPVDADDREGLRWALRSDGDEGFAVISHHQPYDGVNGVDVMRLCIEMGDAVITLPSVPVGIPSGTLARWPVNLRLGDTRLRWATASVLTLLPGPTLVLVADAGIPVEVAIGDASATIIEPSTKPIRIAGADLLVLPAAEADHLWVREVPDGRRQLLRTQAELRWDDRGIWVRAASEEVELTEYDPTTGAWLPCVVAPRGVPSMQDRVVARLRRSAGAVPADYGFGGRRHRAPDAETFSALAAVFDLDLPDWASEPAHDAVLLVEWAGDVGQLRVDGIPVDDRFWDGTRWEISLRDVGVTARSVITLHVLPLSPRSTIGLPGSIQRPADADLIEVSGITVVSRGSWRAVLDRAEERSGRRGAEPLDQVGGDDARAR